VKPLLFPVKEAVCDPQWLWMGWWKTVQALYVCCNIEERSCNHCFSGKVISITCSECVFVVLVIQHAKPKRHVTCVLPSVAPPVLQKFSALSHKQYDFRKEATER